MMNKEREIVNLSLRRTKHSKFRRFISRISIVIVVIFSPCLFNSLSLKMVSVNQSVYISTPYDEDLENKSIKRIKNCYYYNNNNNNNKSIPVV